MSPSSSNLARTAQRIALVGITGSVLLAVVHVTVGLATRSTSVFAAGVEFAGDVLATALVYVGMRVATRPPDTNHPYGHGRVETLSALAVGLILIGSGAGIGWHSLQAVSARHPPPGQLALVVLILAIVIRGTTVFLKFGVGRKIGSAAIVADAWNDSVDLVAAATALVAVGLSRYDPERFLAADHYGGFAIGVIVVLIGVRVARDASVTLIDTMPEPPLMEALRGAAMSVSGVVAVDKAHARKTGLTYHVDLHVEVDPALTVAASHVIAGRVRSRLREELPWVADVLVHIEPALPPTGAARPREQHSPAPPADDARHSTADRR
jgi:cation diffusion facilitator family transporter